MTNLVLPADLAQTIVDYLIRRPYDEVFKLVAALVALQKVEEPDPSEPPK